MTSPLDAGREILLVTKTRTQNQGNQALSIAWRDFLKARFPGHAIRPVERAPSYLKRYRVGRFAAAANPAEAFDQVCAALIADLPVVPPPRPAIDDAIRHDAAMTQVIRFKKLRRMLGLRSRISALGFARAAFVRRLDLFRGVPLVVINPAGEFQADATDTAIAYLIDVRCAQLLGARTAFVNVSFEVRDPTVRALSAYVLDRCDVLQFRDEESLAEYRAAGGTRAPLILPDAALMTAPPETAPPPPAPERIALAINALQVRDAGLEADWVSFIDRLIDEGLNPVLTSNEWSTDEPFWGALIADGKAEAEGQTLDYRGYMALLGTFDIVVSSRLHTCVLAMIAGTAVVPVESGTFKLTGFFRQAGLGALPVKLGSDGWQDRVIERIRAVRANRAAALADQDAKRDRARDRLRAGLDAAFGALDL